MQACKTELEWQELGTGLENQPPIGLGEGSWHRELLPLAASFGSDHKAGAEKGLQRKGRKEGGSSKINSSTFLSPQTRRISPTPRAQGCPWDRRAFSSARPQPCPLLNSSGTKTTKGKSRSRSLVGGFLQAASLNPNSAPSLAEKHPQGICMGHFPGWLLHALHSALTKPNWLSLHWGGRAC